MGERVWLRRVAAVLLSAGVLAAGFMLQGRFWPVQAESGGSGVAKNVTPLAKPASYAADTLPVPPGAVCFQKMSRPDVWGGRFQGMFDCPMTAEEIRAYYREVLPRLGWKPLVPDSEQATTVLSFAMGNRLLTVVAFDETGGFAALASAPEEEPDFSAEEAEGGLQGAEGPEDGGVSSPARKAGATPVEPPSVPLNKADGAGRGFWLSVLSRPYSY